jgi:hypothetical protein
LQINGLDSQVSEVRNPREVAIGINELKNKVNKTPAARARVFMPRHEPSTDRLELSTYCVDGLEESGRWAILALHVIPLVARVDLDVKVFKDAGLEVDADWVPDNHVNILGWPQELERRKEIAQEALCVAQRFTLREAST